MSERKTFSKRAGFVRLGAQLVDGAEGDEFAVVDDADAVGHFLGDAELVGGKEEGHAGVGAFAELLLHDARVHRVEADHRLVDDEDLADRGAGRRR